MVFLTKTLIFNLCRERVCPGKLLVVTSFVLSHLFLKTRVRRLSESGRDHYQHGKHCSNWVNSKPPKVKSLLRFVTLWYFSRKHWYLICVANCGGLRSSLARRSVGYTCISKLVWNSVGRFIVGQHLSHVMAIIELCKSKQPFYNELFKFNLLKLIYICSHPLTVNNRRYGLCYTKKIYAIMYFPSVLHSSRANSPRSF